MTPSPLRQGSRPLLLLGVLLLLGAGQAQAQGGWGGPDSQNREVTLRQQAEAMARLNGRQRRDYFEARRDLERCLERARGVSAGQNCQRSAQEQRMAQRRQEMDELAALQRRFALPGWRGPQGRDSRPAPKPLGPSSYGMPFYGGQQPYGQPYGQQPYGQPAGSNFMAEMLQSLLSF